MFLSLQASFNDPQMFLHSVFLYVKEVLDIDQTDPTLLQCGNVFSNVDKSFLIFAWE